MLDTIFLVCGGGGVYAVLINVSPTSSFKVMELNASDDRGIGIVRGQILNFASTRTIFKAGYKLIILDEADAMTNDAQNALRRSSYLIFFIMSSVGISISSNF